MYDMDDMDKDRFPRRREKLDIDDMVFLRRREKCNTEDMEHQEIISGYNKTAREGSNLFKARQFRQSQEIFSKCLTLIHNSPSFRSMEATVFRQQKEAEAVLRFLHAMAGLQLGGHAGLVCSHSKLLEMVTTNLHHRFPAAYLALALVCQQLFRYEQALSHVEAGQQ